MINYVYVTKIIYLVITFSINVYHIIIVLGNTGFANNVSIDNSVPTIISPEIPTEFRKGYCKPVIRRGVLWNWTRIDDTDIRPCPEGSSGLSKFQCMSSDWSDYGPNLGSCKSNVISDLEDSIRKQEPEDIVISKLARFLKPHKRSSYYGGDIDGAVAMIRTLSDRLQYVFQTESKPMKNKKAYMENFFQNVMRSVSTLISKKLVPSWLDLEHDNKMNIISNLFSALDESAFLLADFINRPEILEETTLNIGKTIWCYIRLHSNYLI